MKIFQLKPPVPRKLPVSRLRVRKPILSRNWGAFRRVHVVGGPANFHSIVMRTDSTLVFTMRGMTGYYSASGAWCPVAALAQAA